MSEDENPRTKEIGRSLIDVDEGGAGSCGEQVRGIGECGGGEEGQEISDQETADSNGNESQSEGGDSGQGGEASIRSGRNGRVGDTRERLENPSSNVCTGDDPPVSNSTSSASFTLALARLMPAHTTGAHARVICEGPFPRETTRLELRRETKPWVRTIRRTGWEVDATSLAAGGCHQNPQAFLS